MGSPEHGHLVEDAVGKATGKRFVDHGGDFLWIVRGRH
jgi:hypothetical protein